MAFVLFKWWCRCIQFWLRSLSNLLCASIALSYVQGINTNGRNRSLGRVRRQQPPRHGMGKSNLHTVGGVSFPYCDHPTLLVLLCQSCDIKEVSYLSLCVLIYSLILKTLQYSFDSKNWYKLIDSKIVAKVLYFYQYELRTFIHCNRLCNYWVSSSQK